MRILNLFAFSFILISCSTPPARLNPGIWRGVIEIQGQALPFTFEVEDQQDHPIVYLRNASEKQRKRWRLIGDGVGIHWPDLDEDISIAALLEP